MERQLAQAIYELDRYIECGCCVAACCTARMRRDFIGAGGLKKIAHLWRGAPIAYGPGLQPLAHGAYPVPGVHRQAADQLEAWQGRQSQRGP